MTRGVRAAPDIFLFQGFRFDRGSQFFMFVSLALDLPRALLGRRQGRRRHKTALKTS
jgi:hypothetical protein